MITAVFVGGFSWSLIDEVESKIARGLWYGGLLIALTAVTLAMQQSIALHRVINSTEGLACLRSCLGKQSGGVWTPRPVQVLIWQMPVMLLNVSIFIFVVGLITLVVSNFRARQEEVEVRLSSVC